MAREFHLVNVFPYITSFVMHRYLLIRLFVMTGRGAFRQRATLNKSIRGGCTQPIPLEGPSRDLVVREEAYSVPTLHLLDESSYGDESLLRNRRRVEIGKDVAVDTSISRVGASQMTHVPTFMVDAILAGRSPQTEGVYPGGGSVRSDEGGPSSNVGGGPRVERDGSSSDVDPKDVHDFVEHHTNVEVRMKDFDWHIIIPGDYNLLSSYEQVASALSLLCVAPKNEVLRTMSDVELSRSAAGMALQVDFSFPLWSLGFCRYFQPIFIFNFFSLWQTLIMETKRERRERKRTTIYEKISSKYQKYSAKHCAMADIYTQDPDFQLFREGLK